MLFDILSLVSILVMLTLLRRLIGILPSLFACILRWRDNISFESSVKNIIDRNMIALSMIVPFCLIAVRYALYIPSLLGSLNEEIQIGITAAVFAVYFGLRRLIYMSLPTKKINRRIYKMANSASYSFFVVLSILIYSIVGFTSVLHTETENVRLMILWSIAAIYALLLLRKLQIFSSSCSILNAFLYLCALEFIPTGILVVPVLIF